MTRDYLHDERSTGVDAPGPQIPPHSVISLLDSIGDDSRWSSCSQQRIHAHLQPQVLHYPIEILSVRTTNVLIMGLVSFNDLVHGQILVNLTSFYGFAVPFYYGLISFCGQHKLTYSVTIRCLEY